MEKSLTSSRRTKTVLSQVAFGKQACLLKSVNKKWGFLCECVYFSWWAASRCLGALCWNKANSRRRLLDTSKCRYLIRNKGCLGRAAGKDTPLFINRGCLTQTSCGRQGGGRIQIVCVCVCGWENCWGWGAGHRLAEIGGLTFHSGDRCCP